MALIKCPECGKEVSNKAKSCPNCGYPISEMVISQKNLTKQHGANSTHAEEFPIDERPETFGCYGCGREIPVGIDACPFCGYIYGKHTFMGNGSKRNNETKTEKKGFFRSTAFMLLMCFFLPPIGLVLMWDWKKPKLLILRIALTLFFLTFWPIQVTSYFKNDSQNSAKVNTESQKNESSKAKKETKAKEESESKKDTEPVTETVQTETQITELPEIELSDELSRFEAGGYAFIANADLNKYSPNMGGVKVYVVTEVDDISDGVIQSNLSDGFMMSNFNIDSSFGKYKPYINEGDLIAIAGTVSGIDTYGFLGKSVDLEGCYVFAIGDDARQYIKDSSDGSLAQYFVVTADVANAGAELTEDEYKSICSTLSCNDVLRNPDSYDGKYCVLSGTVSQIIEGIFGGYTIFISDYSGNKWECTYSYKDGESHLLEGDWVTVYGKCKGTTNSRTVLGKQVTMPYIDVEYLN